MVSAAVRLGWLAAITGMLLFAGHALAAEPASPRSAPTRPGGKAKTLPGRTFGRVEYVAAVDLARDLGLNFAWLSRGRKAALSGGTARAELEAGTRDIVVNGLRVFLGDPVTESSGQLYISRIDYERCLTPLLKPGHGVSRRGESKTIVLDPGHGGQDTGTSRHEKTFALDVALRAKKRLEADGFKVVLTRETDVFVEHAHRAAIANLHRADAFISIHFNALENDQRTQGVEVYTFPPRTQNSTNAWSFGQKPNAEDVAAPNNSLDHWNVVLAQSLHRELVQGLKAPDRGKKLMHLKVLRPLQCPGVLIECGFLTSEVEARKIATPEHREKIAEVIAAGVRTYTATLKAL